MDLQPCQTERFILLSSADRVSAAATGRFVDQVCARFYESFGRAGFDLKPPPDKLVCVCFNSYDELDAYGRAADGTEASWMDGYYSTRTNRIALVRASAGGRSQAQRPVVSLAGRAAAVSDPSAGSASSDGLSLKTATHELAHQLAFNSGLQKRGVTYPFWLMEGLATNFEADPSGAYGLGPKSSNYRSRLAAVKARGTLIPLDRFAGMTVLPAGQKEATLEAYSQAWGLFNFLLTHHRAELKSYMSQLSDCGFAPQDEQSLKRRFVSVFGPQEALEKDFRRFIDEATR